jgi:hypothetical protein
MVGRFVPELRSPRHSAVLFVTCHVVWDEFGYSVAQYYCIEASDLLRARHAGKPTAANLLFEEAGSEKAVTKRRYSRLPSLARYLRQVSTRQSDSAHLMESGFLLTSDLTKQLRCLTLSCASASCMGSIFVTRCLHEMVNSSPSQPRCFFAMTRGHIRAELR